MGLILSEPIKKVVEILKILTKMSVEDAKIHPKRPYCLRTCWHTQKGTTYPRCEIQPKVEHYQW